MKLLKFWKSLLVLSAATSAPGALAADPHVDIKTNLGTIRLELYPAKAPKTVENFLRYVRDGHYNGTIFHRVIKGFMVQGGGFDTNFRQKPTRPAVPSEAALATKAGLTNEVGSIAMARTSDPHSATAQFFINVNNNTFLNWGDPRSDGNGYTVFGRVISGMDVVTKITQAATGSGGPFPSDVPRDAVIIESMVLIGAK